MTKSAFRFILFATLICCAFVVEVRPKIQPLTEQQVESFLRDGFLVFEKALSDEEVERASASFHEALASAQFNFKCYQLIEAISLRQEDAGVIEREGTKTWIGKVV